MLTLFWAVSSNFFLNSIFLLCFHSQDSNIRLVLV
ncbi:hypothetical protein OIU79_016455 [Salix purpurea]|uniref:Uncharacterized protein n=1 Tax=Salix purpurea TaxID=77065 RepID=A0A9Q0PES6_SALPP|nr:hypothetical protein OIU79_016455 [Salix purpurea]